MPIAPGRLRISFPSTRRQDCDLLPSPVLGHKPQKEKHGYTQGLSGGNWPPYRRKAPLASHLSQPAWAENRSAQAHGAPVLRCPLPASAPRRFSSCLASSPACQPDDNLKLHLLDPARFLVSMLRND
jgi:hypothetical protein